jgi:hypothetical protein
MPRFWPQVRARARRASLAGVSNGPSELPFVSLLLLLLLLLASLALLLLLLAAFCVK